MENRVMKKSRFDILPTPLSGLTIIQRKPIEDDRGFFCRLYCAGEFREAGLQRPVAQINQTLTRKKGAVRGLHFQYPPYAEAKVVICLKGEIFDVAVDLRKLSPTFLCWHAEILSAVNQKSLLIPEGFAHGFQTLTEDCELMYLHSESFHPQAEGALNVADPRLGIAWPEVVTDISDRDRSHPFISSCFEGILL
jgi:dTDP-4-dehydrorhamnose 3,5-epimerase